MIYMILDFNSTMDYVKYLSDFMLLIKYNFLGVIWYEINLHQCNVTLFHNVLINTKFIKSTVLLKVYMIYN